MRRAVLLISATVVTAASPLAPGQTRMGGHTYRFSPDMFQGGIVETGAVSGILLELAWPEMRGLTEAEQLAWPRRQTLLILANSGAPVKGEAPLPEQLETGIQKALQIALSPLNGDKLTPRPATAPASSKSAGGAMVQVERDGEQLAGNPGFDIWAIPPVDRTTEFIQCSRTDDVFTNSVCSQRFVYSGLELKISYDHPLIDQWNVIHARVTQFFAEREVK